MRIVVGLSVRLGRGTSRRVGGIRHVSTRMVHDSTLDRCDTSLYLSCRISPAACDPIAIDTGLKRSCLIMLIVERRIRLYCLVATR